MNFTKHERVAVRHKIGMCPACRRYLWGAVEIATTLSPPTLSDEGKASVYASARPVAMRLEAHDCDRERDEAEAPFGKMLAQVFGTGLKADRNVAPSDEQDGDDRG